VKALEVRPAYPQALYNLAYAYEEKGTKGKAIETWRRYVSVAQRLPTEREYVQSAETQIERLTQDGKTP
jgi:cytochrome c-type biogenesis protein CcmH/NrfG